MACRSRPITDDVQLAATAGTDLALRLDHHLLVRQVIEIFVAAGAALAGRDRLQRRIGLFFLRLRLGKRGLELIERERQLVIGDALGLAAEMRAADLGDDRLQPLVANGELVALGDDSAMRRTLGQDQRVQRIDFAIPPKKLDAIPPLGAEHVDRPAERIGAERRLHDRRQSVGLLAEVDRFRRHENPLLCARRDPGALRTARSTARSLDVSTWPMMRTTASPIAISIVPGSAGGCEGADGEGGAGAVITTGTNTRVASPISGGRARCAAFR